MRPLSAALQLLCSASLLTADQILRDGRFEGNITQLGDLYSWAGPDWEVVDLLDCPSEATRGLNVSSEGAELSWPGLHLRGYTAGVYEFECIAKISEAYDNITHPTTAAFVLTAFDESGAEIEQAVLLPSRFRGEW